MATAERETEDFGERFIAPESLKTRRARAKLLKRWEEEKELFTPKALKETSDKIHKWIADNAKHRIRIKEKSIRLFNQNQNVAAISKKVQVFAEKIQADMQHFGKALIEKAPPR